MSKLITVIREITQSVWGISPDSADALMPRAVDLLNGDVKGFEKDDDDTKAQGPVLFNSPGSNNSFIQVISFNDVILKNDTWCNDGTTAKANAIVEAANNPRVSGVILSFDSPGGSVNAVDIPVKAIQYAKSQKPVIAHISSGMAASAAYWIASQANEVYTEFDNDQVGSIGTYVTLRDLTKYYEKEGIVMRDIYATASTDKNGPIRKAIEGDDTELVAMLDRYNDQFKTVVKMGRPTVQDSVFTGKLYFSDEAMALGLIDGQKSLDEVIDRIDELAQTNPDNMFKGMFGRSAQAEGKGSETTPTFAALIALAQTAADDRTEDHFNAAQAELNAAGLGVIVTNDPSANDSVREFVDRQEELTELEASAAAAIAAAEQYVGEQGGFDSVEAAMNGVIEHAQAAAPIESAKGKGKAEATGDDPLAVLDELEHNKKADSL